MCGLKGTHIDYPNYLDAHHKIMQAEWHRYIEFTNKINNWTNRLEPTQQNQHMNMKLKPFNLYNKICNKNQYESNLLYFVGEFL